MVVARLRHSPGEGDALVDVHALEEHRHGECRGLTVTDAPIRQATDELLDLTIGQPCIRRAWSG